MKTLFALGLLCSTVFGSDTDIQVVSAVRTNESGSIYTKETFTRAGQTNLIRNTCTKSGVLQIRIHRFYQNGSLVGYMTASPDISSTTSEAGSPYALDFEYGPSNQLKYVILVGKDGLVRDMFNCTNGVLFPIESSELRTAAEIGTYAKELISNVHKTPPGEFNKTVDGLIEKHGGK
jgi:hypothetical protein